MEGVRLSFATKQVLRGLTFDVRRGEIYGFLGPSGAGKTTTIKLLTRQLVKDAGRITVFGRPIENASDDDYERIGILSDTSSLYERMTIEENLRFYAKIHGVDTADIPHMLERVGLAEDRNTLIKKCSKGMRQRAALLATFLHSPELMFLDEPTSGLDPAARTEIHAMLKELKASGTTIFLTTHDMAEAEDLCDRIGILNEGTLVAEDTPQALRLRFARNEVRLVTATHGTITVTKDADGADTIRDIIASGDCLSIHSIEPNLEGVFLELTGKELR
jgi:ABC-2 type transport system ATP-binding protein